MLYISALLYVHTTSWNFFLQRKLACQIHSIDECVESIEKRKQTSLSMQYIANRRWKNADFPKSDLATASFDVRESVKVIFRQSNAASDQVYGYGSNPNQMIQAFLPLPKNGGEGGGEVYILLPSGLCLLAGSMAVKWITGRPYRTPMYTIGRREILHIQTGIFLYIPGTQPCFKLCLKQYHS